ncbi:MAG: DUF1839 family protein [Actinomycetota bacterium]|nr:DUF1839 family protein [Actinomycetota bacterium]
MSRILDLDPATYVANALHGAERIWPETNCYADLWIELLHGLGFDPVPALAFVLSGDVDGDQWRFFKFPAEDLRFLYGIDVVELNPWKGLEHHIESHLGAGRFCTAEVDSFFLPDTAGVAYHRTHTKSSIVANMIDPEGFRLGYFHNTGYAELSGDDYLGIFRHDVRDPEVLLPYVELVRLDNMVRPAGPELLDRAVALTAAHVRRRPAADPVQALRKQIEGDLDALRGAGLDLFHAYAFATLRQCGASAELAAALCGWLAERGEPTTDAAEHFLAVAAAAKAAQFKLARLVAGRAVDMDEVFTEMEQQWDRGMRIMAERYDR